MSKVAESKEIEQKVSCCTVRLPLTQSKRVFSRFGLVGYLFGRFSNLTMERWKIFFWFRKTIWGVWFGKKMIKCWKVGDVNIPGLAQTETIFFLHKTAPIKIDNCSSPNPARPPCDLNCKPDGHWKYCHTISLNWAPTLTSSEATREIRSKCCQNKIIFATLGSAKRQRLKRNERRILNPMSLFSFLVRSKLNE